MRLNKGLLKGILCFSSGVDSTTLLYKLLIELDKVECLIFNYGSKQNKQEIIHAKKICKKVNVKYKVVNLTSLTSLLKSALVSKNIKIPEGRYALKNIKQTIVPSRNLMFLSIASAYAISLNYDVIAYAGHKGDSVNYPDTTKQFVKKMEEVIIEGNLKKIKIYAPFLDMTKDKIVKLGHKLQVDFKNSYSCYKGGIKHCGLCSTCLDRKKAFFTAGVQDPTQYKNE